MVSVIMPTYNRAELIGESISSVLQQSYTNLELIVIDDGSDDATESLVGAIPDARIRYFKLSHSGYVGRARNFGIKQSTGDLIAFIDSDDIWEKNKLQKQVTLLTENKEAGFIVSDVVLFEGDNVVRQSVYGKKGVEIVDMFPLLKKNILGIYPSTFLFKKKCLEKTGLLNEDIRSSDFNFNIRMAYHFNALIIYEPLVRRRIHISNRHSQFPVQNYKDYVSTFEFLFKNKMIEKKYLDHARSNACYKIAEIYREKGEKNAARKSYIDALKYKPFFPACYRRILSSFIKA
jgi:glycosyltransferase involved in cell wall biosynthesis